MPARLDPGAADTDAAVLPQPAPKPAHARPRDTHRDTHPETRRRRRAAALAEQLGYALSTFVVFFLAWEVLPPLLDVPAYLLPVPSTFFAKFWEVRGLLWQHGLVTAQEVLYGFLVGVAVSVPLALLITSSAVVERTTYPLILFLQLIPKIAVAPLFVVWFGFGLPPKVFFTFLLCFFPVLVSAITGLRLLDPRVLQLTRSMGASGWQTFRYVRLPTALPSIFGGMKVSVVLATTGAIVAEFVGANAGLGYLLLQGTTFLDMPLIFAALVALCLLGLLFSYLVSLAEVLAMPWKRTTNR